MKKISFISLIVLIFCLGINVYASGSVSIEETGNSLTTANAAVRDVVKEFFDLYSLSYEKTEMQDFTSIVQDNNNNNEMLKSIEYSVRVNELWGLKRLNNRIYLDYVSILKKENGSYDVELYKSAKYKYNNQEVESGNSNIYYKFTISNGIITDIETDSDEYVSFKRMVEADKKSRKSVVDERQHIDDFIKGKLEYIKNHIEGKEEKPVSTPVEKGELLTNNTSRATVAYNRMLGRNYAQRFAEMPTSGRWFYTANKDCTNFASQCVWAAYGGYVEGSTSETATKANISNRFRMINSVWQAGLAGGGGYPNWEQVEKLWTYSVQSKTYGPIADGYNNNGAFTGVAASSIQYGDVLQFAELNDNGVYEYGHSVFVTYTSSATDQYSEVLVSYHSSDTYNEPLSTFHARYPRMRMLKYKTASFAS